MSLTFKAIVRASLTVGFAASVLPAQQVVDTAFVPRLRSASTYASGKGPVVLIDQAHNNFHTATGGYRPFAKLLEADGFVVRANAARFDSASLAAGRVLVIANAVSAQNRADWRWPSHSAFDPSEIGAVASWVRRGGSLLLIADHQPFAGAADSLASTLGVFFANGFAMPAAGVGKRPGEIVFRRGEGLVRHAITDGRSTAQRMGLGVISPGRRSDSQSVEASPSSCGPAGTSTCLSSHGSSPRDADFAAMWLTTGAVFGGERSRGSVR
jgi:hypothetical protein